MFHMKHPGDFPSGSRSWWVRDGGLAVFQGFCSTAGRLLAGSRVGAVFTAGLLFLLFLGLGS